MYIRVLNASDNSPLANVLTSVAGNVQADLDYITGANGYAKILVGSNRKVYITTALANYFTLESVHGTWGYKNLTVTMSEMLEVIE